MVTKKHSYENIDSLLCSFAKSYFSPLNKQVCDLIFEALKTQDEPYLIILFSERKIEPVGEYPKDVWNSIDTHMRWLLESGREWNVDSSKILEITVIVKKAGAAHKIFVTALDDGGYAHSMEVC